MAKPNSAIWEISFSDFPSNLHCLIPEQQTDNIFQVSFQILICSYLFVLNRETGQELLSQSYGSTGWLIEYGITNGSIPCGGNMLLLSSEWGTLVLEESAARGVCMASWCLVSRNGFFLSDCGIGKRWIRTFDVHLFGPRRFVNLGL